MLEYDNRELAEHLTQIVSPKRGEEGRTVAVHRANGQISTPRYREFLHQLYADQPSAGHDAGRAQDLGRAGHWLERMSLQS